jgi:hypothetical protein
MPSKCRSIVSAVQPAGRRNYNTAWSSSCLSQCIPDHGRNVVGKEVKPYKTRTERTYEITKSFSRQSGDSEASGL